MGGKCFRSIITRAGRRKVPKVVIGIPIPEIVDDSFLQAPIVFLFNSDLTGNLFTDRKRCR